MKDRSIFIRNIYVMMAYAFRSLNSPVSKDIETENFHHLHDLFAEILARGVSTQVKRGLHHDYLRHDERLTTIRGRIDFSQTIASQAVAPGHVRCTFDEFEPDTPFNQALKSVVVLLIRHGEVTPTRKDALRRLLPFLDPVSLVSPRSIRWSEFTYHRTNATYRVLLGLCQLVVQGLLHTEESGATRLNEWLPDDKMRFLYERFLREYFAFHHPDLSPTARIVEWGLDQKEAVGKEQLPAMHTDVTLQTKKGSLIIDAKYYGENLATSPHAKDRHTIHSANLYQLFAYVKNAEAVWTGKVSGLLLYARTDAEHQPSLDVRILGNRIQAHTLDLGAPWEDLRAQLEAHCHSWLDEQAVAS